MQKVHLKILGKIDYQKAWDYQGELLKELIGIKRANRLLKEEGEELSPQKHYFLFCEHLPVYTLGRSGSIDHLLYNEQELEENNISFYKINRGGDITFHGLGQVVGYPIFDLDEFFTDVHKYVRFIEEAIIRTLADFGLEAGRVEGYTGVWLTGNNVLPERKICAIGVHLSRWVTMHGFALNVNTDLKYFNHIVPCGISEDNKTVTSMAVELKRVVDMEKVQERILFHFSQLFGFELADSTESLTSD
ncbi:MAG: lipoyl(octanoyl) transferase [Polaribacter sp.]|jgi:lipoyl(octanoyl) transferase